MILLLILGAVMTVLIAWGCALWAPIAATAHTPFRDPTVRDRIRELPENEPLAFSERSAPGISVYTVLWHVPGQANAIHHLETGWPWPALAGQSHADGKVRDALAVPASLNPRSSRAGARVLPLRPLPRGFLLNTLAGMAALYVVAIMPGQIRRQVRRLRGRCRSCGYDLRGADHERCPECGARHRGVTVT